MSKVVERMLAPHLLPFLEASDAYGKRQFAHRSGHGYRDTLAYNAFTWIWALGSGKRVAVFCSDVSGAFDRVSAKRLLHKLKTRGVHQSLLKLIESWLGDRTAFVCVDGCLSEGFVLSNMFFQGTVLGLPLWMCIMPTLG